MKKEMLTSLVIAVAATILSFVLTSLIMTREPLDIQFHDTYIILNRITTTLLILTPVITLTFLVRGALNQFKGIGANIGIIVGLTLAGYYQFLFFIALNWTWAFGLVFVEGAIAILLLVRTIKEIRG